MRSSDSHDLPRAGWLYPLLGLALALFLYGIEVHDHGRTTDDMVQRRRGEAVLAYLGSLDPAELPAEDLNDYSKGDRLYGPLGSTLAVGLGRCLAPLVGDPAEALHLEFHCGLTFFFVLLFVTVLFLGRRWTGTRTGGVVAGLALLAQPRIWGMATSNPSDLPASAMMALGVLFLLRWMDRPTWARTLSVTALVGASAAVRAQNGPLLLPMMAGFLIPHFVRKKERPPIAQLLAAPLLCYFFWILFWPDFWREPFTGPAGVLGAFLGEKRGFYDHPTLWFGETRIAPPCYPFVMLWLTTPLWILVPGTLGCVLALGGRRTLAIGLLVWFLVSTGKHLGGTANHGGVRHFLDAYVPLSLWAASGSIPLARLLTKKHAERLTLACMALLLLPARSLHPFESSYFNLFCGGVRGAAGRLSLDPSGTLALSLMKKLQPLLEPEDVLLVVGNADLARQLPLPENTLVLEVLPDRLAMLQSPESRKILEERRVFVLAVQSRRWGFLDGFIDRGELAMLVQAGPLSLPVGMALRVARPAFLDRMHEIFR